MALIVLDRQHVGKPGKNDTGAWGDFDKDGQHDVVESEAIITAYYGFACEVKLRTLGHNVIVISDGPYADRHERAKRYKADVYVALHLNAGGGDYSLVLHDHRSANGVKLAKHISDAFAKLYPKMRHRVDPTGPNTAFPRGFPCISGVFDGKPVAALVEPLFIDNAIHQTYLMDPLEVAKLGQALADGIHSWLSSR